MNQQMMVQGLGYDPSSPVFQTGAITRLAHPASYHIISYSPLKPLVRPIWVHVLVGDRPYA